jgi:hypothetical protein
MKSVYNVFNSDNKKLFINFIASCLTMILVIGCQSPEVVHPHEDPVNCKTGCERLVELKCTEMLSQLDSETGTCDQACEQIIKSGGKLNLECWQKTAKTCADIDGVCAK